MLKFARHNRSSSVDRNGNQDRVSVSSLSPPVKGLRVSSPATSPTSSNGSTRRRSRTSSLERISMRNSLLNNNQVLSQYYNSQQNQQKDNASAGSANGSSSLIAPNFIIPKSPSMFVESYIQSHGFANQLKNLNIVNHNHLSNNSTQQPLSLDSYQSQHCKEESSISKSKSVRTANIVNCNVNSSSNTAITNINNSLTSCLPISPKSIKPIISPPTTPSLPQKNTTQYPNVNSGNKNQVVAIINHQSENNGIDSNTHNNPGMPTEHQQQQQNTADSPSPDYEAIYSGKFCRILPPPPSSKQPLSSPSSAVPMCSPSVPMTPTLQKLSAAINSNHRVIKLKSVLKKKQPSSVISNNNTKNSATAQSGAAGANKGDNINAMANNNGYDFHRVIEKLVGKMDLQLLDTSSESGYGSDQDSLTSNNSNGSNNSNTPATKAAATTGAPSTSIGQKKLITNFGTLLNENKPPSLPPRLAISNNGSASSPLPRRQPPPIPSPKQLLEQNRESTTTKKKRVRFDSYVLFLQGLRERDLELVQTHIRDVCDAALATDEVVAEFLATVIEGREAIVRELLAFGFAANTVADPTGMTPLHLAAAFNHLPLVRILLAHGAAAFTRAHSSGKVASELCSRQLPGYQACHAYLRCMEECLGVANGGKVYATQSYRTTRCDELGLEGGEELTVTRKGDYNGSSWWQCCNRQGQQGYVLQDLLALNKKSNTHHIIINNNSNA